MSLSPADIARIETELEADRQRLLAQWIAAAPKLDRRDVESREVWTEAREKFYSEVGPIPTSSYDREQLASLKDRYRGERIFVIGNGPSLNRTALHLLENEFTFGVNRIYLMFDRLSWRPTFYTTLDWRFVPDATDEVNALSGMQLFFPERFKGLLRDGDDVAWYSNDHARHPSERGFASDASLGVRGAGSVSGAAIQLAFHMGFEQIHLIGCDVSYAVADTVIQEGPDKFGNGVGLHLTSTEDDDANHFDKRYFGVGKRWHDPNVGRMITGFEQCQAGVQRHGRSIDNATVGGKLEVFDRVNFRALFGRGDLSAPVPSLASYLAACVCGIDRGVMLDIGSGAGTHLAAFGALDWMVRAVEPSSEQRKLLYRALPQEWDVVVDPRAVDVVGGSRSTYSDPSLDGISLAAMSASSAAGENVVVATLEEILEPISPLTPNVVAIDANCWEMEILGSWPSGVTTPEWLIVGIDDAVSPRFGFDRVSVARELATHGYEVLAVDSAGIVRVGEGWAASPEGGSVVLVAGPAALVPSDLDLQVIMRSHQVASGVYASAPRHLVSEAPDRDAQRRRLEHELAQIRASMSWRLGHGIVQAAVTVTRHARRFAASAKRQVRRWLR